VKTKQSKQTRSPQVKWSNLAGAFGPLLALVLILTLAVASSVWAMPQMPQQLYGNVTMNGGAAPAGVPVVASIDGVEYASTVTDASGKYGYSPQFFRIPGDDPVTPAKEGGVAGDTVQLSVAGAATATTNFASGSVANLNLAVTPQANPATPPTPPAPAPTVAPPQAPSAASASSAPSLELVPPAPLPPPAPKGFLDGLMWPIIGAITSGVIILALAYLLGRRRSI